MRGGMPEDVDGRVKPSHDDIRLQSRSGGGPAHPNVNGHDLPPHHTTTTSSPAMTISGVRSVTPER
ncbi:hypothetical protein [Ancylobacter oerskovii]|uniref:Uncharacterized protein n=1 Tax=Ancylobacter oerskovii TaxID=459519 RepID=A0ABW4YXT7_9HYPH